MQLHQAEWERKSDRKVPRPRLQATIGPWPDGALLASVGGRLRMKCRLLDVIPSTLKGRFVSPQRIGAGPSSTQSSLFHSFWDGRIRTGQLHPVSVLNATLFRDRTHSEARKTRDSFDCANRPTRRTLPERLPRARTHLRVSIPNRSFPACQCPALPSSRSRVSLTRYSIACLLSLATAAMLTATPIAVQDVPGAPGGQTLDTFGQVSGRITVGPPAGRGQNQQ